MIIRHRYVNSEADGKNCPFCGEEVDMTVAGEMSLHHFYCNRCKVEFTLDERVVDEERQKVRNLTIPEAIGRWNTRAEDAKGDECPFCGEKIEEWPWGHYLFDSLYCPNCKKRFQFQSHGHSKRSMVRTMREFAKRA